MVHGLATIKALHDDLDKERDVEDAWVVIPPLDLSQCLADTKGRYDLTVVCFERDTVTVTDGCVLAQAKLSEFFSRSRILLDGYQLIAARKFMVGSDFIDARLCVARIDGDYYCVCDRWGSPPGTHEYFRLPWPQSEGKYPDVAPILEGPSKGRQVRFYLSAKYLQRLAALLARNELTDQQRVLFTAHLDSRDNFSSLFFSTQFTDLLGNQADVRGAVMLMRKERGGVWPTPDGGAVVEGDSC